MSTHYYNQHVAELAASYEALDPAEVHTSWSSHLVDLRPGLALDVGAGTGRDARWLAGQGWEVVVVEPSDLFQHGCVANGGLPVVWFKDRLPALKKVREVGYRFDLILLSAVWQHVAPADRMRAFRVLSDLLNPGGRLVITLRYGSNKTENVERGFHAVSRDALTKLARDRALVVVGDGEVPDARRADVRWGTMVFQSPDDGSGGLSLLRHIVINDNKSATYKLGLLRVLARIAESFPGAVTKRDDCAVTLPLGLVGLLWLKQYRPLLLNYDLPQLPQSHRPGFAKAPFQALAEFADPDLHVGASLEATRAKVVTAALRDACQNICKMPAHYMTYPGTDRQIFEANYTAPRVKAGPLYLSAQYLARFGTVTVPLPIWQSLGQFACWLEPAIINEWLSLMRQWSGDEAGDARIQPNLFRWEESTRFTGDVRRRLSELLAAGSQVPCTWTGRRARDIDVDHAFPWSRWPNNDLWNLVPAASAVNRQKSDRLPTVAAFEGARSHLLEWWQTAYLDSPLNMRFLEEVTLALPGLDRDAHLSADQIYAALLYQRARIKRDQQLADWTPR